MKQITEFFLEGQSPTLRKRTQNINDSKINNNTCTSKSRSYF